MSGRRASPALRRLAPILWVGPAVALIGFVVLWPVLIMLRTAFQHISPDGFILGWSGVRNFVFLWQEPGLFGILGRTALWVAVVVAATMVIALALAQLFNQRFPLRRAARWALDPNNGAINVLLHHAGLLRRFNSDQSDWLGSPGTAFAWMMAVAVFVSVPFSTYALLAGLQSIPGELYEAARVDGAGAWRTWRRITLPLLRPAFVVALLINVINVFNSFPIIWEMTRGGPGHRTSTTTTFMYQLKQSYIGESAAMSLINFAIVVLVVALYLRATVWRADAA